MIGHLNNDCFKYCSCVFQTAHRNSYLQAEKRILSITMSVLSRAVLFTCRSQENSNTFVLLYTKKWGRIVWGFLHWNLFCNYFTTQIIYLC